MSSIKNILLSEKTYIFLLSATLISIPLPFAYSTASFLCLLAVSLASVLYQKPKFKLVNLLPVRLFGFMCLSLLWTINTGKTLKGLERQLLFVLVPLAFITMPKLSKQSIHSIIKWFSLFLALLGAFFMINALALYFIDGTTHQFFYHGLVLPLELNAIYLSVMVAFSLLFTVFFGRGMKLRWLIASLLSLFLVMLASKNVIPTTVICLIIGFFVRKKISRRNGIIVVGGLAIIIAGLFFSPLKQRIQNELSSNLDEVLYNERFESKYPWTGTTIRVFQARVFGDLYKENDIFWLGLGMNASQAKIVEKHKEYNLYFGYNEYNFHNQYLQSFSELGIFGLILTVALLIVIFRHYWRHGDLLALFFGLLMTAVFITESLIWRHRGMLFFLIIFGLLLQLVKTPTNTEQQ